MSSLPVGPVVVGVDGSESARAAVAWAARHASRAQLPLRIVHAFGWPLVRVTSAPSHWTNGLRAEAWTVLEECRNQACAVDPELVVTTDLTTSFSVPLLLRESQAASLVVVGTHGLGGFCGLLIGSTGVELASRASAPTVVIRGRAAAEVERSAPTLVGYDGSPASDLAVAAGFGYAALHDRPLLLLQVSRFSGDGDITRRMVDLVATWRLVHPEIDVSSRVVSGHPGGALTEASENAALVIVGSRGRDGFRGLALGSVSQSLLHHARCPVMVLPPAILARHRGTDPTETSRLIGR